MNAFIVVDIIECCACMSQYECVRSEDRSRNGRGSVNGKEGANSGELAVDFFFLNVEETSDVLDHLFMGVSHLFTCRTVRRRRGDDIRDIASAIDGR